MASQYQPTLPTRQKTHTTPPTIVVSSSRSSRKGRYSSVLDQNVLETPVMTYTEATAYIQKCLETSTIDIAQHTAINLLIYDPHGNPLEQSMDAFSIKGTTLLTDVIIKAQVDLNSVCIKHGYPKLLVKGLEVMIGNVMDGMPTIKGELVGELDDETVAEWIRWRVDGGEMEQYYEMYKTLLLQIRAGENSEKPTIKVTTVRREGLIGENLDHGGHMFDIGSAQMHEQPPPHPQVRHLKVNSRLIGAIRRKIDENQDSLGITTSEITFATLLLDRIKLGSEDRKIEFAEAMELYRDMMSAGSMPIKELTYKTYDGAANSTEPKSWAHYQKKGGHPQVHVLIELGHVPFLGARLPVFVDEDDPDFPGFADYHFKRLDTNEVSGENIVMIPYKNFTKEAKEVAERETARQRARPNPLQDTREAAIGLDDMDDDVFFSKEPVKKKSPSKHDAPTAIGTRAAKRPKTAEEIRAFNLEAYGGSSSGNAFSSAYLNSLATSSRTVFPSLYMSATHASNMHAAVASPYQSPSPITVNPAAPTYQTPGHTTNSNVSSNQSPHTTITTLKTTVNPLLAAFQSTQQSSCISPGTAPYQSTAAFQTNATNPNFNRPTSYYQPSIPGKAINPMAPPYTTMGQAPATPDAQYGTSMRINNAPLPHLRTTSVAPLRTDSPASKFQGTGGAGTSKSYHAPNMVGGQGNTYTGGAGTSNSHHASRFFPSRQPAALKPKSNFQVDLSFDNAAGDGAIFNFGNPLQ